MTILEIDGVGRVEVDESFMSMSPADQEKTVNEIKAAQEPSTWDNMANVINQGAGIGLSDEVGAAGQAVAQGAMNLFGADGPPMGEVYDSALNKNRSQREQFREESPGLAYGGEVLGGLGTAIGMTPKVVGPLLSRIGKSSAIGATQGGIYGYNSGEGGVGPRLDNAKGGAIVGGIVGGAAEPVGDLVSAGVGNILRQSARTAIRGPNGQPISPAAYDILARNVIDDPRMVGRGLGRLREGGDQAMLADADPWYTNILDNAATKSNKAGILATDAIDQRVTQASQTVNNAMDDALGAPQGVKKTARDIASNTRADRSAAYTEAFNAPIDYASAQGRNIESVLSRIDPKTMQEAVEVANRKMGFYEEIPKQIRATIDDAGNVTFDELPNVMQLDYLKRALQDKAASFDEFGRMRADGLDFKNMATTLRDAISDAVPAYRKALDAGADKLGQDQALRLGRRLLTDRTTREDVAMEVAGMTPAQFQAARQGVRSYVDDMLANVKAAFTDTNMDAREAAKALKAISSRANREKLGRILDPQEAEVFFNKLDEAQQVFSVRASIAENSKTAGRQFTEQVIEDATTSPLDSLKNAAPLEAGKDVVRGLTGSTPKAKMLAKDQLNEEIVRILTETRGPRAAELLRELRKRAPFVETAPGQLGAKARGLLLGSAGPTGANVDFPLNAIGIQR